jgi:hypothetical protein
MVSEIKLDRERIMQLVEEEPQSGIYDEVYPTGNKSEEASSKEDVEPAVGDEPTPAPHPQPEPEPIPQPEPLPPAASSDPMLEMLKQMAANQQALAAEIQMMRYQQPQQRQPQYEYQPNVQSGIYGQQQQDPQIVTSDILAQFNRATNQRLVSVEQRFLEEDFNRSEAAFRQKFGEKADSVVSPEWRKAIKDAALQALADGKQIRGSFVDVFETQMNLLEAPKLRQQLLDFETRQQQIAKQQEELSKVKGVPTGSAPFQEPPKPKREPGERGFSGLGGRITQFIREHGLA